MKLPRYYRPPTSEQFANLPDDMRDDVIRDGTARAFPRWKWWLMWILVAVPSAVGVLAAQRLAARHVGDGFAVGMTAALLGIAPGSLIVAAFCGFCFNRRVCQGVASVLAERGRCTSCGYSLAGNASGVCPECGMPVAR